MITGRKERVKLVENLPVPLGVNKLLFNYCVNMVTTSRLLSGRVSNPWIVYNEILKEHGVKTKQDLQTVVTLFKANRYLPKKSKSKRK